MTLTSSEVAKLQKHNADLVRENETLTRDNAELRGQIAAIKKSVLLNDPVIMCFSCKFKHDANTDCKSCRKSKTACNWQPPSAEN